MYWSTFAMPGTMPCSARAVSPRRCSPRRRTPAAHEKRSGNFLHTTLQPIGELIATEASEKLETTVSFDFARLSAADVQGRARAFQSLVRGGDGYHSSRSRERHSKRGITMLKFHIPSPSHLVHEATHAIDHVVHSAKGSVSDVFRKIADALSGALHKIANALSDALHKIAGAEHSAIGAIGDAQHKAVGAVLDAKDAVEGEIKHDLGTMFAKLAGKVLSQAVARTRSVNSG